MYLKESPRRQDTLPTIEKPPKKSPVPQVGGAGTQQRVHIVTALAVVVHCKKSRYVFTLRDHERCFVSTTLFDQSFLAYSELSARPFSLRAEDRCQSAAHNREMNVQRL